MAFDSRHIASQTAAAATISGNLFRASITAKQMALAAKNAKVMVLRAGSRAAGLKVISNFFDELANKTINLSGIINQCAISISQNSVKQWRTQTFLDRVRMSKHKVSLYTTENESVQNEKDDPLHDRAAQLTSSIERAQRTLIEHSKNLDYQLGSLRDHLDDIHHYMQSGSVVAVTFRLEATQTGEFQPILLHMASTIDELSNEIKGHISTSQSQLTQFNL